MPHLPASPEFDIIVPDVSERDTATLAVSAFAPLHNARLIDSKELIRLVYRFIAEVPPDSIPTTFSPINLPTGGKPPAD